MASPLTAIDRRLQMNLPFEQDANASQGEANKVAVAWAIGAITNIQVDLDRIRGWLLSVKL
jgi:hypothetical protein